MAKMIEAGWLAHVIAADMLDADWLITVCQTRRLCGDIAIKTTRAALQIYGGPGWGEEALIEKYYRDARILKHGRNKLRIKKTLSLAI